MVISNTIICQNKLKNKGYKLSIKLIPVEPKKNVLVIALQFMHGDADAYTYKHFNVKIVPEKSESIEEILSFLRANIWRISENDDWDDHWDEDENHDEESNSETTVENELVVNGYNMTFVIDGIRVSVEGESDATTDHSSAASASIGEVLYFDEESREFKVTGF